MDSPISPLLFVTALAAGMVSFASPCVLPLVPAYLGFITGRSAEELHSARGQVRVEILTQGLAFVLGLAIIFALLGASASVLGRTLLQNQERPVPGWRRDRGHLRPADARHHCASRCWRAPRASPRSRPTSQRTHVGAFAMGLAFGAGWTPCVGPFLAGLLGAGLAAGDRRRGRAAAAGVRAGSGHPVSAGRARCRPLAERDAQHPTAHADDRALQRRAADRHGRAAVHRAAHADHVAADAACSAMASPSEPSARRCSRRR